MLDVVEGPLAGAGGETHDGGREDANQISVRRRGKRREDAGAEISANALTIERRNLRLRVASLNDDKLIGSDRRH